MAELGSRWHTRAAVLGRVVGRVAGRVAAQARLGRVVGGAADRTAGRAVGRAAGRIVARPAGKAKSGAGDTREPPGRKGRTRAASEEKPPEFCSLERPQPL